MKRFLNSITNVVKPPKSENKELLNKLYVAIPELNVPKNDCYLTLLPDVVELNFKNEYQNQHLVIQAFKEVLDKKNIPCSIKNDGENYFRIEINLTPKALALELDKMDKRNAIQRHPIAAATSALAIAGLFAYALSKNTSVAPAEIPKPPTP